MYKESRATSFNDSDVLTEDLQADSQLNFRHMMSRDERRFRAADRNGDLNADKHEFNAFLHPEEQEHMKDIVVQVRVMSLI